MWSRILRYQLIFLYILLWILLAILQYLLFRNVYGIHGVPAITDSLVSNLLFALLGTGLWYMTRFSDLRKRPPLEIIFFHLVGCTVTLILWLGIGSFVIRRITPDERLYLQFLDDSIFVRIITGALLYGLLVTVFYLLINFRELKERIERESQLTALLREAELNMLKSQIRPHFLFNSLNSVSALTMTDPQKAQEMVIKLSELMRYSINFQDNTMSDLDKELYHLQLYLEIEKVRFSEKLKVEFDICEECHAMQLPAMILQPLVENAVKHGVYESTEPVVIRIRGRKERHSLILDIANNFDPAARPRKGTGTGLKNTRMRLETVYRQPDLMEIDSNDNTFHIRIQFPQIIQDESLNH